MSYCTPYLLSLGLTKSRISLVWVAGPLSGIIMQPIVGVIADRSTSRWGRRRPFMFFGTILVALFLLLLGWTKEVVSHFVKDDGRQKSWTIVMAVLSIYGIDFAINAVQGSCRGLVVDTLPLSKQQQGGSWASRMVAVGNLIGYGAGAVDLKSVFGGWLGDTQFKQLTAVAALTLCCAVGVTSWAVEEKVRVSEGEEEGLRIAEVVGTIWKSAVELPRGIQALCNVQFWAWIGMLRCRLWSYVLISGRMVSIYVLQHYVDWRSLSTLRRACRNQRSRRLDWQSWSHRLFGPDRFLLDHVCDVYLSTVHCSITSGRQGFWLHTSAIKERRRQRNGFGQIQALAAHRMDGITLLVCVLYGLRTVRAEFEERNVHNRNLWTVMGRSILGPLRLPRRRNKPSLRAKQA